MIKMETQKTKEIQNKLNKMLNIKFYYMNAHQPIDEDILIDSQYLPTAGGVTW